MKPVKFLLTSQRLEIHTAFVAHATPSRRTAIEQLCQEAMMHLESERNVSMASKSYSITIDLKKVKLN